jgi:hypothetical protein
MNGNITAISSGWGSGIGAGRGIINGTSLIQTLSIMGGRITANGTLTGIGSGGNGGEVEMLRFSGTAALLCDANSTAFVINASSIELIDCALIFTTPHNQLFGISPSSSGSLNLAILFGGVTSKGSEPLTNLNGTFLQIGNVNLPDKELWTICISGKKYEHCIESPSRTIRSILFSTDGPGNRLIRAFSANLSGFLVPGDGCGPFIAESNLSFFPSAQFVSKCRQPLSRTHPPPLAGRGSVNSVIFGVTAGSLGLVVIVLLGIVALLCRRRRESHRIELKNDSDRSGLYTSNR